jgi:hypothetical protein
MRFTEQGALVGKVGLLVTKNLHDYVCFLECRTAFTGPFWFRYYFKVSDFDDQAAFTRTETSNLVALSISGRMSPEQPLGLLSSSVAASAGKRGLVFSSNLTPASDKSRWILSEVPVRPGIRYCVEFSFAALVHPVDHRGHPPFRSFQHPV